MMQIVSNIPEVQAKFNKVIKQLPKANIKSVKGATLWGQRWARRMAPVYEGKLKAGIKRRQVQRKGKVVSSSLVSTVPKAFPYHFWVNEVKGFKRVRLARKRTRTGNWPSRSVRNRWPKIYTKRLLYRQTRHTGVPGYFTKTFNLLAKKFPEITQKELTRTLKIMEAK